MQSHFSMTPWTPWNRNLYTKTQTPPIDDFCPSVRILNKVSRANSDGWRANVAQEKYKMRKKTYILATLSLGLNASMSSFGVWMDVHADHSTTPSF